MGKLLQLRRAIMSVGADESKQLQLLLNGLSTMMVLFRGALRVAGQEPSMDYVMLSREVAAVVGFEVQPFERLVQQARRAVQIPLVEVQPMLLGVLDALGRLVAHLDRAGGSARSPAAAT